jgi:hypothetical protein
MKKLILIPLLFIHTFIYSQARINAELAKVTDTGKELADVKGWYKNEVGQWKTTGILPSEYTYRGISYFDKLKLYSVAYKNKEYILLEIVIKDWDYENPTVREGRFYFRKSYFYIIENENFTWFIKENEVHKNQIQILSFFENSERWLKTFRYIPVSSLPELVTLNIEKPDFRKYINLDFPYNEYVEKTLDIFTFYYKDDNAVRFYFCDNATNTMPEDYYFECSLEHFADFFNSFLEE